MLNEAGSTFFFRVFEMKILEDILPQNLGKNSLMLNFVHLSNPVNSLSAHTNYRNFSEKKAEGKDVWLLIFHYVWWLRRFKAPRIPKST